MYFRVWERDKQNKNIKTNTEAGRRHRKHRGAILDSLAQDRGEWQELEGVYLAVGEVRFNMMIIIILLWNSSYRVQILV